MYDLSHVVVSSSPHIKSGNSTRMLMLDVIIALMPALVVAVVTFGARALTLTAVSVLTCIVAESLYNKVMKKPNTIGDLSAVITGILLAFNVSAAAPMWMVIVGSAFSIVVVKCLFGGLGKNFMNPALAGRAFMMASWAGLMTTWVAPKYALPLFASVTDVQTTATPLASLKEGVLSTVPLRDMLLGQTGGCIGEVSAAALIIGGLYLVYREVISLRIPLAFIGTVAALTFLFPRGGCDNYLWMMQNILSGGLMLGAIFMATDYTTSPVTPKGQILFGIGCGLLTVFIRYFGGYPEGVSYSILIMTTLVWAIDKWLRPRKYGYQKPSAKRWNKEGNL